LIKNHAAGVAQEGLVQSPTSDD